jgi:F-type H+-transporting ATPase subunit a
VDFFKGLVGRGPRKGFNTLLTAVIDAFIGALEVLDELTKLLSFSFRLFGNIFAGEVLLIVISMLLPFVAPLPFLALEIFVGYIQALIFSTLTLVFVRHATHEGGH